MLPSGGGHLLPPGGGGNSNPTGGNPSAAATVMADREAKALEAASESLLARINEVKGTIAGLVAKLETDPHLNWPSFLDSYALVSGQLNSLLKTVKHERTPTLKRYICLPLHLSPERDEDLHKLTEGRVATFSHDLVPDYLRTKPDPEVEQKHNSYESRAAALNPDAAAKQVAVMNKINNSALKNLTGEREALESHAGGRAEMEKTCEIQDTYQLVAAISHGKGLKPPGPPPGMHMGPMGGGVRPMPPGMGPGGPPGAGGPPPPPGAMGKAPGAIKTNIKAATQVHPYGRP